MMDTCFSYSENASFFSSDEKRWINHIHRLKEQYPDMVTIVREPEENNGCIYAKLPYEWLKVKPPIKREFTEEQLQALKERMSEMRGKRGDNTNE